MYNKVQERQRNKEGINSCYDELNHIAHLPTLQALDDECPLAVLEVLVTYQTDIQCTEVHNH